LAYSRQKKVAGDVFRQLLLIYYNFRWGFYRLWNKKFDKTPKKLYNRYTTYA